jgi:predicted PurR-regulated permease PerM
MDSLIDRPDASGRFRRRAVFASFVLIGLAALALAAWILRTLILMVFLAILFGVVLRSLGDLLHRATGLRRRWAVLALVAVLVLAVAAGAAFVAPTLADQIGRLVEQVPQAADQLQRQFGDERWLGALWSQLSSGLNLPNPGEAVSHAGRIVGWISESVGYAGLVLVAGLFLALEPDTYRDGLVRLIPVRHRASARDLLDELDQTILSWLGGQLILMAFVGILTGLGLWAIGVPYALALGLLAGLLEFVPYLGPILSAVPILLVAAGAGWKVALWALALVIAVQQLENNILQPLVERKAVEIPPALLMVMLFAMGQLFGVPGLLVAAPLTAVLLVIVRRVYIERVLESDEEPQLKARAGLSH